MTKIVQAIVKIYFVAAVAGSFTHIIESASKLGLTGWEMWSTPFMIDGLAIIGMVMRSEQFSRDTQRSGLRTQIGAGVISLAANVYAASTIGGYIFGVGIVVLFLVAESLSNKIESAEADAARDAAAKAAALAAALADKRSAASRKAAETKKRNAAAKAKRRKQETKILEEMISN